MPRGSTPPYSAGMERVAALLRDAGGIYRRVMTEQARWFDAGVAAGVGVLSAFESSRPEALLAALVLAAALAFRRRAPYLVYALSFAVISVFASQMPLAAFVGILVAGYTLAAYGRWPLVTFMVMLASAIFVTLVFRGNLGFLPEWSTSFLIIGTLWLAGNTVRARQRRADELEARAVEREREQEQERQLALAEQRTQIARELHDVVTHHVAVMVIQAGAARHVMKKQPAQAAEALLAVEARGREALAELRGFLGVLDDDPVSGDSELAPQPGTADIGVLIRGVVDAGLPVSLEIIGERRDLPHGVDLDAYRVVQEALTNAIKYADGSATEVVLDYRVDEVTVEILDAGPGRGASGDGVAGRGLAGLRKRLAVYGGRLEAGRRPSGGFAVRAWIPTGGLGS